MLLLGTIDMVQPCTAIVRSAVITLHMVNVAAGGADIAGADREDLEQLERAVRGRLLETQILKLSAQCRASQSQFDAYLDVASTSAKPKVGHCGGRGCSVLLPVQHAACNMV